MAHDAFKGTGHQYLRTADASGASRASGPCRVCSDFDLQAAAYRLWQDDLGRRFLRIDLFDLAESADADECIWCALLWRAATALGGALPTGNGTGYVRVLALPESPVYFDWESGGRRLSGHIFTVNTVEDSSPAGQKLSSTVGGAKEITTDIDSEECLATVREWVEECFREHDQCPRPSTLSPRRLLDLGANSHEDDWSQLRLNDNPDNNVPYAALSHCWGSAKAFTTTKETLSSRLSSISWESLPLTFRDALVVTRKLGLRYTWIDSLCIVQDDEIDWHREAQNMGQIYENSYVTIAAALAAGDEIGFLQNGKERAHYASETVDLSDFGVPEGAVKVRLTHDIRTQLSPDILATRGWALQESLLPPRLLTFSVTAMFECLTASRCECGASRLADPFCGKTSNWLIDRSDYHTMLQDRRASNSERYNYWLKTVVRQYSLRAFSKSDDRLIALSALASRYAASLNDTYLAGLWRRNLDTDLAWCTARSFYAYYGPLPVNMAAPSWSWASLEGEIVVQPAIMRELKISGNIRFLSMEEHDTTNRLLGSHCLRLRGAICPARLLIGKSFESARLLPLQSQNRAERGLVKSSRYLERLFKTISPGQTASQSPESPTYEVFPRLDTYLVEKTFKRPNGSVVVTAGRPPSGVLELQAPLDATVFCLHLLDCINSGGPNEERHMVNRTYLLVLEVLPEHNAFRRIGLVVYHKAMSKRDSWLHDSAYRAEIRLY